MKVTAIVGTYRKGGVIDTAVDAILARAQEQGAEVSKTYLLDKHVEFCRNCRDCTQEPGERRGTCSLEDEIAAILDELEGSDAIVLASPTNFGTVTAIMKRFIERFVCYGYWPWRVPAPKPRVTKKDKRAVLVASSAAPAILARMMDKTVKLLKYAAALLGAETTGVLFIGLAAQNREPALSKRTLAKARRLGEKLASSGR